MREFPQQDATQGHAVIDDLVRGFWNGWERVTEYVPPWIMVLWLVAGAVWAL